MATITYDIVFDDGTVAYGVASNIAAAARRAMRIAEREGVRVVSVSDRYARERAALALDGSRAARSNERAAQEGETK